MDEISARRVFLAGFLILALTLFYSQIIQGSRYAHQARSNYARLIPIRSMRGTIYDRNGTTLAIDKAAFNIAVIPHQIKYKKDQIFQEIADYLKIDKKKILRAYTKGKMGAFTPVNIVNNISKETALLMQEQFGNNMIINCEPQRYYPYAYECAHLLGYVKPVTTLYEDFKKYDYTSLERGGVSGIEQYYNTYMRGTDGGDLIEVNAAGKRVGFIGQELPVSGSDIYLTIDARIQKISYEALKGRSGCVIIMNSETGELICLTVYPSYDPNLFISGGAGKYFIDESKPLLNRAIQSTYPMGSVFKPMEAIGALEENIVTPHTSFHCSGAMSLGNARFRCWSTHGTQDLYQALAHSCDVYFYSIGKLMGPDMIAKWARKFNLDRLTDIDIPFEKSGFIPDTKWKKEVMHDQWYGGDTLNFSIGQGFMHTTPISMVVAMNVFASEGAIVRPYTLMRVGNSPSSLIRKNHLNISQGSFKPVIEGLRLVVDAPDGTASNFKKLKMNIHGKTGTAQNSHGLSHGWYVGYFTQNDVKYTFGVFIENCGTSHYAAAAGEEILKQIKDQNLL